MTSQIDLLNSDLWQIRLDRTVARNVQGKGGEREHDTVLGAREGPILYFCSLHVSYYNSQVITATV